MLFGLELIESFPGEVGTMDYVFLVPRSCLPEKNPAAISRAKEIPIALLREEGMLARRVLELGRKNNYPLVVRAKADSFTLLMELMKNGELGAVVPRQAAESLSQERFAHVELPGIETLNRELRLVYQRRTYDLRESLRKLVARMTKIFSRKL